MADSIQKSVQKSVRKFTQNGFAFVCGCLGISPLAVGILALPAIAQLGPPPNSVDLQNSAASQRLLQMFSAEIQTTIGACADQGKVDLAVGASSEGSVICGDGSSQPIAYADYLNTVSDILAASGLIGFKVAVESDPRVTPEILVAALSNPEASSTLYNAVQSVIVQSQLLPADAEESTALLASEVVGKLQDNLHSASLEGLLGTSEQYAQVVGNFCTAPGMSVEQAQQQTPGLTSIQLYAICVQESGIADEILRLVN